MGSENLHHKRKRRTRDSFKRKIQRRDTYDVVLIVCEGKKTEPSYLKALCEDLKLNSANIKVIGVGADPLKIVEFALKEFNKTKDYDRIFCLFDKDQHASYQGALRKIQDLRERNRNAIPIYGITSVPCFEYWLLLHFIDSTKPYNKTVTKSSGDFLLSEIANHISGYHKGYPHIFEMTKSNLQIAIDRAKRNYVQQEKNETDNPSTNVYELIEYLRNIKSKRSECNK